LESRSLRKAGELFSFWCGSGSLVHLKLKSKILLIDVRINPFFPYYNIKKDFTERD